MKTSRTLLIAALLLLTAGLALYHLGSQISVHAQSADSTLWEQARETNGFTSAE